MVIGKSIHVIITIETAKNHSVMVLLSNPLPFVQFTTRDLNYCFTC